MSDFVIFPGDITKPLIKPTFTLFGFSAKIKSSFCYMHHFFKFFVPIHKLSNKKFLLLCLTSNLVRGDITASLKKIILYLVFKYRKSSICKAFTTLKLLDGKIAVLGLSLPWCASCTPHQSFRVVNANKYTITLTQTKYNIIFFKGHSNIPRKNCAVKH